MAGVESSSLIDLCPNVVDLDLSGNLLESWEEILPVISQLRQLNYLNLARNNIKNNKVSKYLKAPEFSDTITLCFNLPKTQTKRPNFRVFCQKEANRTANSEDPDQTAPLGAV